MPPDERRQAERLAPPYSTYITLISRERAQTARLLNLSADGAALAYGSSLGLEQGDRVNLEMLVDIDTQSAVTGLRCQVVYDFVTLSENGSFKGSRARQCGLAFVEPSDTQHQGLMKLLSGLRKPIRHG